MKSLVSQHHDTLFLGKFVSPDSGCWGKGEVSLFSLLPFWGKKEKGFYPCHNSSLKNKGIFIVQKVIFLVASASFYLLHFNVNFLRK